MELKLKEALQLEKEDFKKRMEVRRKKGADYGKNEQGDILSNFKEVAQLIDTLRLDLTKPHGVAMFFVLHKITRIVNLWNKGTPPQNESLRDSFIDLNNYVDLSKECYTDWMKWFREREDLEAALEDPQPPIWVEEKDS